MPQNEDEQAKVIALAKFLETEPDEIDNAGYNQLYNFGSQEYLVLTDEEADERAKSQIRDSLWAFNGFFLGGLTKLDSQIFATLSARCENANDAIEALVKGTCGLDYLVEQVVNADGRGYFLSTYDGEEIKLDNRFYAYRTN